jgi:hypothetical protein
MTTTITTSYFASQAPKERKVCIARKCPKKCACPQFEEFAPLNPWAAGDWRARYRRELQSRFPTPESLRAALDGVLAVVDKPILCCYEKNPADCHRRELAQYILTMLGQIVPEWTANPSLLN